MAISTIGTNSVATDVTLTTPTLASPTISGTPVLNASIVTSGTPVVCAGQTSIPFSTPAWAERITIVFSGVSTSGSSNIQVQLGIGATPTYVTTGYVCQTAVISTTGANASTNNTTGIVFGGTAAGNTLTGQLELTNVTGNSWVATGSAATGSTSMVFTTGGITATALGGPLTAIRVTTVNGTDTFDTTPSAGTVNILYE